MSEKITLTQAKVAMETIKDWFVQEMEEQQEFKVIQPRPLSKGDLVMALSNEKLEPHLRLIVKTPGALDNRFRAIAYDGSDGYYGSDSSFTRIDTLTEEHLKMLDNEIYEYKSMPTSNGWKVEQCLVDADCERYDVAWFGKEASDTIEKAVKSVISRRRLDREMGV